nr:acetyl-CoA carboxylase - phage T7 [Escherichia phage T7]
MLDQGKGTGVQIRPLCLLSRATVFGKGLTFLNSDYQ